MSMIKLFVYGTLRPGMHNHHMIEGAAYLGPAKTQQPMALVVSHGLPHAVATASGSVLVGDLFEISKQDLGPAHFMEVGAGYQATWHTVQLDTGELHRAVIYTYNSRVLAIGRLVESGDFKLYYESRQVLSR